MRIRWLRVFVGALLLELVLFALTIPVVMLIGMEAFVPWVPPVCLVVSFVSGWWTVRKMQSAFVLHGTLVGILATLMYFALVLGQLGSIRPVIELYGPLLFVLANGAKILGSVAGAYARGRQGLVRLIDLRSSHAGGVKGN